MRSIVCATVGLACLLVLNPVPIGAETTGNDILDRAIELHCTGQLPEAIDEYKAAAASSSDPIQVSRAEFAVGACYFAMKEYDSAVDAFLVYAAHHPANAQAPLAIVYAGNCRMDQERFSEARELYEMALQTTTNWHGAEGAIRQRAREHLLQLIGARMARRPLRSPVAPAASLLR